MPVARSIHPAGAGDYSRHWTPTGSDSSNPTIAPCWAKPRVQPCGMRPPDRAEEDGSRGNAGTPEAQKPTDQEDSAARKVRTIGVGITGRHWHPSEHRVAGPKPTQIGNANALQSTLHGWTAPLPPGSATGGHGVAAIPAARRPVPAHTGRPPDHDDATFDTSTSPAETA
jgi:hypothetical protein